MIGSLLARLWHRALAVSLRVKILVMVGALVLLLGSAMALQTYISLRGSLRHQLQERGLAISGSLAAQSADYLLTDDAFSLYELVRTTLENNDDVRYLFILDAQGNPAVHSFPHGFPEDLLEVNPVSRGQDHALETLDTEEGLIHDLAVPILGGRVGVAHVGMSERSIEVAVRWAMARAFLITAFVLEVGMGIAYLLTSLITRPISELVRVTQEIGRGELGSKASLSTEDEIGQLGTAFNTMTEELRESRDELQGANRELRRRNRELAALNAIAAVASRTSDLERIFASGLTEVLEVLDLPAGSIFLLTEDNGLRLAAHVGLSEGFAARGTSPDLFTCLPAQVMEEKVLVLTCTPGGCPQAEQGPGCLTEGLATHAIVPLRSQARIVGLMDVGSSDDRNITTQDMEFLESVGAQMGMAIENAGLWDELKEKEELRGQLLERVIVAQEEERKRIARELHDEASQTLASLILGLKVAEGSRSLEEIRGNMRRLKALTAETLDRVRDLALQLRPSVLDDLGLVAALERYAGEYSEKFGIVVDLQALGFDSQRLPTEMETALYRIVQEALTNVMKHAQAQNASIVLERRGSSVVAIVEDDGKGFDAQRLPRSKLQGGRLGLFGMQERAELIGGTLTLESKINAGTTVFVEVPIEKVKV